MPDDPRAALYPLPAFYFKVAFTGLRDEADTSFREVRGIGAEFDTEEVVEGGENRFVHRLPTRAKHQLLELKRGVTSRNSALVRWCRTALDGGMSAPIQPCMVKVFLLDEEGDTAQAWSFSNAYPVKWEIDEFNSTKNDVAIETISLSYTYSNRIV